jgi:hypothetical protein
MTDSSFAVRLASHQGHRLRHLRNNALHRAFRRSPSSVPLDRSLRMLDHPQQPNPGVHGSVHSASDRLCTSHAADGRSRLGNDSIRVARKSTTDSRQSAMTD